MSGPIVVVEASQDTPLVWFDIAIRGGASLDPVGIEGLHRHTAMLARRGAGTRDRAELDETLDSLGAALDVGVARDSMSVSGLALSRFEEFTLGFSLASELLRVLLIINLAALAVFDLLAPLTRWSRAHEEAPLSRMTGGASSCACGEVRTAPS